MKKRGIISLEALVKFIPAILIAITALYVLFTLWGAFFSEEMTIPQTDLLRVASNIKSLSAEETIDVFTKGKNYQIVLYPAGNTEPICSKKACICVQEEIQNIYRTTKCEVFHNDDCSKTKDPNVLCIKTQQTEKIDNTAPDVKIDYVVLTRNNDGNISLNKKTENVI
ncbi:hypothetical protein KY333_02625 [Candidatus Woesearchaeota archaeon]|nr:hypothetical protein [Candidatus Woesearchaeota archaeon]